MMNGNIVNNEIILIIEDRESNLSSLIRDLQISQYGIFSTQNKQEDIIAIASIHPSLIILDASLDETDIWQICQTLKGNSRTTNIPIFAIAPSKATIHKIAQSGWENIDCVASLDRTDRIKNLITKRLSLRESSLSDLAQKSGNNLDRDLDNFTSTISKDLDSPLRSLTTFAELLVNEYQDDLDAKAQKYLERIADNSAKMQNLVEDLRTYSRAGKSQQTWVNVDLNLVWQQVEKSLSFAISQTKAKIIKEDLPKILINPKEIEILFYHLLDNGIKFRGEENPTIEVIAAKKENEWLISIRDNGVGIESEFQDKIFQAFYKINYNEKYPGTGIGLAICQKIIRRYGGKIGVKSIIGQGSTFYFTLPSQQLG